MISATIWRGQRLLALVEYVAPGQAYWRMQWLPAASRPTGPFGSRTLDAQVPEATHTGSLIETVSAFGYRAT